MKKTDKTLKTEYMVLNFGPQHPATHGTLRIALELEGETIRNASPEIGFLHSGFEKLAEHRTYNQFIPITDRMNYLSAPNNNIGFSIAVEKLLDIEVPIRCQYLRVIFAELGRIADHLISIGMQAVDIGAFTIFLYGFKERERIYDLFELACGSRMTTSLTRVGGLYRDIPNGFKDNLFDFLKHIYVTIDDIDRILTKNMIWIDRTRGISAISKEDAISWGLTGPCLRATGMEWDLRKKEPYSSYNHFNFEIPVGENGDVYDRYLVRMEEIRQSAKIIYQAIENLPGGPIAADNAKIVLPPKEELHKSMEAMIHHFMLIMPDHGLRPPEGEIYSATESPNGELGFFIVSDGSNRPYRIHVRAPSFINYSIFSHVMKGGMISDIVAVLGSLNIIAGELDR
jgi:NADH-quinone oxidoreductase subunit D